MSLAIRPFELTDADYEAVVAVHNALWPDDPASVESLRYREKVRNKDRYFVRLLGELDGRVIASAVGGEAWWSTVPDKYHIHVSVVPEHQRRGVGTQLHDRILDGLTERGAVLLETQTREDKPDYVRFLTNRGYEQVMRQQFSKLDVEAFDESAFAEFENRPGELGLEVGTLAEFQKTDPDWQRAMWELDSELMLDVPFPEPIRPESFEEYVKHFGHPSFLPEAWFLAKDGDRYVGMSCLWKPLADPDSIYTGLTGVRREYRRKGVATSLKVRAIRFAREYGARYIKADNEENNPMYQLNVRLGFRPTPAWLMYHRKLNDTAERTPPEDTGTSP